MKYISPEVKLFDALFNGYVMAASPVSGSFGDTWDTGEEELDF